MLSNILTIAAPSIVLFVSYWVIVSMFVRKQPDPSESLGSETAVRQVLQNQLVWTPVVLITYGITMPVRSPYSVLHLWWQLPLCYLLHDVFFYALHRAFHTKYLRWMHEKHHMWVDVRLVAAFDAHPIEHVIANVLPMVLASYFARLSFLTTCCGWGCGSVSVCIATARRTCGMCCTTNFGDATTGRGRI